MRCLCTFIGCGWAYGCSSILLPPQMFPQMCGSCWKSYLMQVCKPCHYALVEAVEPFKLHPMSLSYIHKGFECLLRMWMGIWLYTHTVTTTDASPDLWELAEILPDASVQTMPLRFDWGCRTFQTASHAHVIHVWEVWVPFQDVDCHMASIHIITSTDTSPDLWELAEILPNTGVQTMPLCFVEAVESLN